MIILILNHPKRVDPRVLTGRFGTILLLRPMNRITEATFPSACKFEISSCFCLHSMASWLPSFAHWKAMGDYAYRSTSGVLSWPTIFLPPTQRQWRDDEIDGHSRSLSIALYHLSVIGYSDTVVVVKPPFPSKLLSDLGWPSFRHWRYFNSSIGYSHSLLEVIKFCLGER